MISHHLDWQADPLTIESENFDFDRLMTLDHVRYNSDTTFSTQLPANQPNKQSLNQQIIWLTDQQINKKMNKCYNQ